MKQKQDSNTEQGHRANTLLYAVAPNPKLSTDAIALDGAVVSRGNGIGATSETYLMDCIVGMKHYPDKYFDLAVVDPPYGIGESLKKRENTVSDKWKQPYKKQHNPKEWDKEPPSIEYFTELFRVSKNQIVWGANHFISRMPYDTSCWLVWDKRNGESDFADCEIAWASFDKAIRKFDWLWNGFQKQKPEKRFHPTQKPVALYDWIFQNYSEPGQRILDTHLGSGSSRIAAHKNDLHFTGFEIDEEYFLAQEDRFQSYQIQLRLFNK